MKASGQKAVVLGMGVSGMASARFLTSKGYDVFLSDQGDSEILRERAAELLQAGICSETGGHTLEKITAADFVVISPGIPPTAAVVQAVEKAGKPLVSEIEVAGWFCPTDRIIAVTGSSGKTTVTTLLGLVFNRAFGRAITCGNIGNPFIAELDQLSSDDFVILELSSFQLSYCHGFRPKAGILLNLSPNHQDWHRDMKDYAAAKLRLFQNQKPGDYAVVRESDRKAFFPDFSFRGDVHFYDSPVMDLGENPNERAVRLVARFFGVKDSVVDDVLKEFPGIEHRMEKVRELDGVTFVNDSKCTTTASLAWALEKYGDGRVVLIAGGHPKSADFDTVRDLVARKVKQAVLIGEARPVLRQAWAGACPFLEMADFSEAVRAAHGAARPGDVVLLSPACASFDMFKNYMDRGRQFKELVRGLAEPVAS